MRMGDDAAQVRVEAIPTGALSLDLALGVGGLPRGRIVEIFGPESSGKTTLVYHVLANAQKLGGICAFIDAEHAMDPAYAKRIGVDVDELLVSQPDHGEQALEIADLLIRSGAVDVVAIDSVAALTPKVELEGAMGDQTVGLQARMMSQAMRKLAGNLNRANTLCLLHQPDPREGRRDVRLAGDAAGRPGAQVLRVAAARHPPHRDPQGGHRGGRQPGAREGRQEQGRGAVPPGRVRHRVRPGHLEPRAASSTSGIEHGIVQKSGSFFSYGDERLGQGRNNVKGYLREHPRDRRRDRAQDLRGARRRAGLGARWRPCRRPEARPSRTADAAEAPPDEATRSRRPSALRERRVMDDPRASGRCELAYRAVGQPRAHRCRAAHRSWSASGWSPRRSTTPSRSCARPGCSTTPATRGASPRTSASSTSWGARADRARAAQRAGSRRDLIEAVVADQSREAELRDRAAAARAARARRRRTTASATAPGGCWSAAATRPSSPTRPCGATSARPTRAPRRLTRTGCQQTRYAATSHVNAVAQAAVRPKHQQITFFSADNDHT